jgi:hypothetical protein
MEGGLVTAFDLVVERLSAHGCNPRRNGQGTWEARCPAHDDRRPSLSVKQGTKAVLVKCHAGCATRAVLDQLELRFADLRDEKTERLRMPKVVATYDYIDTDGTLLFQVVRRDDKTFTQRRPDPERPGRWVWNLEGVPRVLYRLPAVLAAVEARVRIFVVEGEKDADALVAAGEVATTNPGGAGKWRADYGTMLAGAAEVIVVGDRDEPGRNHAATVAEHLAPFVTSVRIVEARTGKDAADHLGAGHSVEEFVPVDGAVLVLDNVVELPDVELVVLPPPWEPMAVARELIAWDFTHTDGSLCLRHWRGGWWRWRGSRWTEVEDREVRGHAYRRTEHAVYLDTKGNPQRWAPNRHKIADLTDAMSAITFLPESVQQPAWTEQTGVPEGVIVACGNGLLHVPTRTLFPHDPRFFNNRGAIRLRGRRARAGRMAGLPRGALAGRSGLGQRAPGVVRVHGVRPARPPQDPAARRPDPRR